MNLELFSTMPRRLLDDSDLPGDVNGLYLGHIGPLSRDLGHCALIVCLQAALAAVGQSVNYAWLMGLSGVAFMLRINESFNPELAVQGRWTHLPETLALLGRKAVIYNHPSAPTLADLIKMELQAQRPVIVQGWGDQPHDWALIVGKEGPDLLGRWPGSGQRPHSGACHADLVLVLGEPNNPASVEESILAALYRARALLEESATSYQTWIDILAGELPYGLPSGRRERVLAEQWLVQCLADARWAGAEFLRQAGLHLPEAQDETLSVTAERCCELAEDIERLLVSPDALNIEHWGEGEDCLAERRELLANVAAREQIVCSLLRRALDEPGNEYLE